MANKDVYIVGVCPLTRYYRIVPFRFRLVGYPAAFYYPLPVSDPANTRGVKNVLQLLYKREPQTFTKSLSRI